MSRLWACVVLLVAFQVPIALADEINWAKREKLQALGLKLWKQRCSDARVLKRTWVENLHDPRLKDLKVELGCPHMRVGVYVARFYVPPRELPDYLELDAPERTLPTGVRLGMRRGEVERLMGVPDGTSANVTTYIISREGPGSDLFSIHFNTGRASQFRWEWHVE